MAEFRIDPPAVEGATPIAASADLLAQLGQRAFSIREDADGWHISGNVTEAEVTTVLAGFAARRQQAAQAEATRLADLSAARALVVQTAAGAVGVRFDALTATQVRALAAILFWREGALTATGVVRPLAEWVRQT